MAKIYTQAPLPFMGQKRRWNKDFKAALLKEFGDCHTFVDLFGGSGLLSHFAHTVRPDATIIYNDYDGYLTRLQHISETNVIIAQIRAIMDGYPRLKRIVEPYRTQIISIIEQAERTNGYVDYVSLSNSILFAAKYATSLNDLRSQTFYNRVRTDDFNADGYLDGITIVHQDYRNLYSRYKDQSGVCFIADPPYLSTQVKTYSDYWKLRDYFDVLNTLRGNNYFYFTSEKSDIIELCEWLETDIAPEANPLNGATKISRLSRLNYSATYNDIMLYKRQPINARRNAA